MKLARPWVKRWLKRLGIGALGLGIIVGIGWYVSSLSGHTRALSILIPWSVWYSEWRTAEVVRPWSGGLTAAPKSAEELYRMTNIWRASFKFTRKQWEGLKPYRVPMLPNFWMTNGMFLLRNPAAPRSGGLGAMGYAFDWTRCDLEFAGLEFKDAAVRKKGNVASFLKKHPFKVDLNKHVKGQKLAGTDELTLNNLAWDQSCATEALAYEFFRDCGAPAPRTAYAWVTVSIDGKESPYGLYSMIEPIDGVFMKERFGSAKMPLFKPVTYDLFKYLGEDWAAYEGIYDLKTEATAEQKRQLIEFAKLLTGGTDEEFARQVGEYLDLDEFARFLAGVVLTCNYDSFLSLGQNFYMYLDARSNKFGFVPWDVDSSWGDFWLGSREELADASIWHPWVGEHRFLDRLFKVEEFRKIYRAHLEDFSKRLLEPARMEKRMKELAAVLREPIAAESTFRLKKFEQTVGLAPVEKMKAEGNDPVRDRAYPLTKFFELRQRSVIAQLEGKSKGFLVPVPSKR